MRTTIASSPHAAPAPKLAQQVAERIEQDIVGSGWQVGELLGSEAALAARYGVSRWVLREAVHIAAQDGLVEIRRGRFGGIAVSAPVLDVVASSVRRFLSVSRVTAQELYEARHVLETFAAQLARQHLDEAGRARLQALRLRAAQASPQERFDLPVEVMQTLLRLAGNAALGVFADALAQVTAYLGKLRGVDEAAVERLTRRLLDHRLRLVEAVLAGDMAAASAEVAAFLRRSIDAMLKSLQTQHELPLQPDLRQWGRAGPGRPKLTERIAWLLERDIIMNDRQPGTALGSEAELMQRYGASRSVVREAIRPLERLGAVAMCRGKDSGLKVGRPDPEAIVRSVVLYLRHARNDDFTSFELRRAIELAVVERLARADAAARERVVQGLDDFAARGRRATLPALRQAVHELGRLLADGAGNRVFAFLLRILAETVLIDSRCVLSAEEAAAAQAALRTQARALAAALQCASPEAARASVTAVWDALRHAYDVPRSARRAAAAVTEDSSARV